MEELTKTLLPRFSDPRALGREMIARKWLTAYQVNQLLQGNLKELALGQYNILERLDDTFLGQVYKARHQHMLRLASLTIVRENLLAKPGAVERFYQEIQAASRLTHPNILCALDAGPIGRTHFFALEYLDGVTLDRLVRESGPVAAATAASYIRQTAQGLQHAYERRILHHDLKPANLLLTRGSERVARSDSDTGLRSSSAGSIKICNLGLTLLRPRGKGDAVPTGDTVDFLAPEQAAGAPLSDVRSNLYSLGCVFYFLLTGRPPFPDGDSAVKLQRHQKTEPEPVEAFRNDVPGVALDVLQRLLAKDPQGRYATPAEVAQALAAVPGPVAPANGSIAATVPGFGDKTHSGGSKVWLPDIRLNRRKWLPWAAGLLALVALVGVAALFLGRSTPPPPAPTATEPAPPVRQYRKGATRQATILASLKASGYPNLEGKWYLIGPFDNTDGKGFDAVYPPEKEIDLAKSYPGKGGATVRWQPFKEFALGQVVNLNRFKDNERTAAYLYHEMDSAQAESLPISFGSDDTLTVWGNGHKLVAQNEGRGCKADQAIVDFPLRRGKNELLIKVCNGVGPWQVYVEPRWPAEMESLFGGSLNRDFPVKK